MKQKTKHSCLFSQQVPGVAENRPSVLRGDCLRVSKSGDTVQPITVYAGYVHRVELDSVKLGFSKRYEPSRGPSSVGAPGLRLRR